MEPLYLEPVGISSIWGGSRLKNEFNKKTNVTPLAETWECSVHPDGPSTVTNGIFKGKTLREVLALHPEFLGQKAANEKEMPILIKMIDAADNLSVQVHPNDEYAQIHENQKGKTEMWYIIDAQEGAAIVYGFKHSVTKQQLKNAINTGKINKYLNKIPVHKDDVFFIPSGTVHAIGKGIIIAEIQESSNVTYRFYDYDRTDKNGSKRELHIDKALDVVDLRPTKNIRQPQRLIHYNKGCAREIICRCEYFEVERIIVSSHLEFSVLNSSFQSILCLEGAGTLTVDNKKYDLNKGQSVFFPAGDYNCTIDGRLIMIKVRI